MLGIRCRTWLLVVAMIGPWSAPRATRAGGDYFPKLAFLPANPEVNDIIDSMTSVHLEAMREPSLYRRAQREPATTSYRFLWLATGEHPISIRLDRTGAASTLRVARHDGPPGLTAGKLTVDRTIRLTEPQAQNLVDLIERTRFWTAPTEVQENRGIADGDGIVIEGIKGGKYHVINRAGSAAGESYKAFCRLLLDWADEPAALKDWDRRRREERGSPDYLAEPPQTEDRGDFKPVSDPASGDR